MCVLNLAKIQNFYEPEWKEVSIGKAKKQGFREKDDKKKDVIIFNKKMQIKESPSFLRKKICVSVKIF